MLRNLTTVLAALLIAVAASVHAQSTRPHFEVASIKANDSGSFRASSATRGGRFIATNYTLKRLIQLAYSSSDAPRSDDEIVGGPDWINTDHFDVEAKSEGDKVSKDEIHMMLQSLLKDRCELAIHMETRQLPVYNLAVSKQGKLKLSPDQTPPDPATTPVPASVAGVTIGRGAYGIMGGASGTTFVASAVTYAYFRKLFAELPANSRRR